MTIVQTATLEALRCALGLSRRQMLTALGARPRREALFDNDRTLDPWLLDRAYTLQRRYEQWKDSLYRDYPDGQIQELPQLAAYLGVSAGYMRVLARRYLTSEYDRTTGFRLSRRALQILLDAHECAIQPGGSAQSAHTRGPLSGPFLRWLAAQEEVRE